MGKISQLNETESVACIKLKFELKKMSTDRNNCSENKRPRMQKQKPVPEIKM